MGKMSKGCWVVDRKIEEAPTGTALIYATQCLRVDRLRQARCGLFPVKTNDIVINSCYGGESKCCVIQHLAWRDFSDVGDCFH
jgi:hypothetical protein